MQLYAEKDRNGVPVIKQRTWTAFRCVPARNEPWSLYSVRAMRHNNYWHFPHNIWCMVYETVACPSVRLSVLLKIKVKVNGVYQLATSLTATGTHVSYGIRMVLPATRQRWHSLPYPSRSWSRFSDPGGMQGWVELVWPSVRLSHHWTAAAACGAFAAERRAGRRYRQTAADAQQQP